MTSTGQSDLGAFMQGIRKRTEERGRQALPEARSLTQKGSTPPSASADLMQRQPEISGKELREHYQEERQLRRKLDEWNGQLTDMLQQATSITRSFQERLGQGFGLVYAHRDLVDGIEMLAGEAEALANRPQADVLTGARRLAKDARDLALLARSTDRYLGQ